MEKFPILFICENNLYSVYSGLEVRQPKGRKIFEMVRAFGIESNYGDGNNVQQVSDYVELARDKILLGNGPQFLEFDTYRWREHCGPNYDNILGYRNKKDFDNWKKKDPIIKLKKKINKNFYPTLKNIEQQVDKEIAKRIVSFFMNIIKLLKINFLVTFLDFSPEKEFL